MTEPRIWSTQRLQAASRSIWVQAYWGCFLAIISMMGLVAGLEVLRQTYKTPQSDVLQEELRVAGDERAMEWCWSRGGQVWTFNGGQYNGCIVTSEQFKKMGNGNPQ